MMREEEKDDDDVAAIATTDDDDGRWHDVRVLGQSRRGLPPAVGEGRAMRPSRRRHIIIGGVPDSSTTSTSTSSSQHADAVAYEENLLQGDVQCVLRG